MPPIPSGYVLLKFRFILANDAEEQICTLGVATTAVSTADRIAVCNSAMDAWGDNILPLQANNWSLVGCDGVFGDASGDIAISSTDAPRTGGDTDAGVPTNTAVLIQKVSGLGGRRNRGRMFVPGISVLDVTEEGTINPGPLASWGTAANNFLLGIESGSFMDEAVIFHSVAPLTPTVVADLNVSSRLATQRRRMRP